MYLAAFSTALAAVMVAQQWMVRRGIRAGWLLLLLAQIPWTVWDLSIGWAALGPLLMGLGAAWNGWRGWRDWEARNPGSGELDISGSS